MGRAAFPQWWWTCYHEKIGHYGQSLSWLLSAIYFRSNFKSVRGKMPSGTWGITNSLPEVATVQRWVKVNRAKTTLFLYRAGFCFVSVYFWGPRTQLVFNKVGWFSGTCLLNFEHRNWNCSLGETESSKALNFSEDISLYFQYIRITFWILPRTLISTVIYWGLTDLKRNSHVSGKKHIAWCPKFK